MDGGGCKEDAVDWVGHYSWEVVGKLRVAMGGVGGVEVFGGDGVYSLLLLGEEGTDCK